LAWVRRSFAFSPWLFGLVAGTHALVSSLGGVAAAAGADLDALERAMLALLVVGAAHDVAIDGLTILLKHDENLLVWEFPWLYCAQDAPGYDGQRLGGFLKNDKQNRLWMPQAAQKLDEYGQLYTE
jgi:hypothetical protein